MFELVFTLLLAAHLLCLNIASAGPLIGIWLDVRAGRGDPLAYGSGRWLAWLAVISLVAGSLLGIALGWLNWSSDYQSLLGRLSSKIFFGVWEIVFSLVLLIAYAWWWKSANRPAKGARIGRVVLSLLSSSNLLYHFPSLMFVMAMLELEGKTAGPPVTAAMFRSLMVIPNVLANSLHFLLAAIAVSGMALVWFGWRRTSVQGEEFSRVAVWGARIALAPTLLQIPVGIWVLTTLDPMSQDKLMGSSVAATSLFVVGLLAAFRLMHDLASVALGDAAPARLRSSLLLMLVTVLLMTGALRQLQIRRSPAVAVFKPGVSRHVCSVSDLNRCQIGFVR